MKKNANLFHPFVYIALGCCIAMTAASVFYHTRLFYVCLAVTGICSGLLIWQMYAVRRSVREFLSAVGQTLTAGQQETMERFPIPAMACGADGEIYWCNDSAIEQVLNGENNYGMNIQTILGNVNVTVPCPVGGYETEYQEKSFVVYTAPVKSTENDLYMVYFFENTRLKRYTQEYFDSRPSIMLILVDNYEELQSLKDNDRTRLMGDIEYTIGKYVSDHGGLMLKSDRDRFTVVVEERHLRSMISSRFELLEQVRDLARERNQVVTLSVGVGRDAGNLNDSEQYARQALDMALGRGGDQAAVHSAGGYEFFGGVSSGVEKQTKVKTRIVAAALMELINSSDSVFLMGHRNADLDCFGAVVGLCRAVQLMGKNAHIVIRKEKQLTGELYTRLVENGYEGVFLEPEAALQMTAKKTLLIICDTHTKQVVESPELYAQCKSVVVIDHHRKMVGHIDNAVIFYHEPYASSASEMVTELLQYFGEKIRIGRLEAESLLAGIMLDTKNFIMRTGVRTFEAAAYLRRLGADTVEVKRLFASSMDSYQRKVKLVAGAEIYRGCAIALSPDRDAPDMQVTAAQAADELLTIQGVQASFLIFEMNGLMWFSARSMGQLNVQLIMEKLGGGGHLTMAGAQLRGASPSEAKEKLIAAIDEFFAENERK
ncbi:MAG: hypothetical protein HFG18_01830 [Oscillospiraceae bacterium]|nr:hypothetical protein [Oscillospiraceae bacterium]RKJ57578.1 hypothetical protein D7X25_03875 [bacterium 1XD42-8]RKJ65575.1 hypothetical protein D7Y09_05835 [bacterium 1XD42-1]MCI9363789.1 hypothetical protein [Oscillospiraceae bacterium]MCI9668808.1 hypothetical protein [Oscillospiraceae bacterium]